LNLVPSPAEEWYLASNEGECMEEAFSVQMSPVPFESYPSPASPAEEVTPTFADMRVWRVI